MQKLQDSVFSIVKTTNLSPAVFNYLQPSDDYPDKTPLGGILSDTKHGWLALGPKFCVVDLQTGLRVAARTFGASLSNFCTTITSVVEVSTPLTNNSKQLLISLECEDFAGLICVFHVNGSQILRCIQTDVVITELAVCDGVPDGPFSCFDGVVMAGTKNGEVFVFELNRASLMQALKDVSQGYEQMIRCEENAANITFLPLNAIQQIEAQRDLAIENDDHIAVLLNENSLANNQYIFRNPDGTVRIKAKQDHVRVTVLQYIPQLGSVAVGFNFGAFQIWNVMNLTLEFTSQVNVECLPVTHFGFQEPCDDPRAFCYLWVVFSVIDRFEEEEFPLAVMYSLTYQGKRMLSNTKCLYQEFLIATIRFQVELSTTDDQAQLMGGRCVSCHSYSVNSSAGGEGEDSMLNICQLVWECWGENADSSAQHGLLLFDLDQWYKDQMPATYQLQSNAFMSATCCAELARGACATLDVRLAPASVCVYSSRAATRLEEHFYPNSLHYNCICLNTSEACVLSTIGIQRQIINSIDSIGPTALLNPARLHSACVQTGLTPLYLDSPRTASPEEQRQYLLSVALEARLSTFLKRCAHDWATGSHNGAGCTLTFLVDWCWQRAIELKENARELTSPLFTAPTLPDRNLVRCLEHCVQQLTQLTSLLDAVLTKCCNLVVPDALSCMEEKHKGIGAVSLYFRVVQWLLHCGLLPERSDACAALPYPTTHLATTYTKRRLKLQRLQEIAPDDTAANKSCSLLYIDQLIEHEFGGERIHQSWIRSGSESHGLYPPPSLYALLRLYLLPDVAEEHKHSLVLYLLVDYSMVYDEVRYEAVIRRLMQFPTMFGLSNTAIKATQAFWHLDHRDFDFALDQLQCLTGNTLSEWQHHVVLSSLLAQKKTQAALQYLHVRKPPPIQSVNDVNTSYHKVNDHDKLDDWQSCCGLYLSRGLVFEALDVVRMCVRNAASRDDKAHVLNYFFKGCRNAGHLFRMLQVTLLPFEEEVFLRYLENCNESQTSDILIMYYLQQARYLEAEQYNKKMKLTKSRAKDLSTSVESLLDVLDREGARDTLVEVVCASLPTIANTVAHCALERDVEPHVFAPKPMSVFVQAKSPKNTFTYKSSFIQDTIENASETWIDKPKMRRGIKRALNIEDTPFICTPKLARTRSLFLDQISESTPPKRARLDLTGTPRTPAGSAFKTPKLSRQMATLLDMPEVQSPDMKLYERSDAGTPHSILKIRSGDSAMNRDAVSPCDSRYLGESDDDMMETASNHTHYSDSNRHLRFTIPTASESGSTPSPPAAALASAYAVHADLPNEQEREMDVSAESYGSMDSHAMNEPHPLESPPKKLATNENVTRKSYKDSVRARHSLSISANSSLSDDPNTSIESIADIPITLINPRYSRQRRSRTDDEAKDIQINIKNISKAVSQDDTMVADISQPTGAPKTPSGRRGIRESAESTPVVNKSRSRSVTPERMDSPVATPLRPLRITRSRSRTPELSPRILDTIPERPKQEVESEPHPVMTTLLAPKLRSRSRTPERIEKVVVSPRLEAITESPTKTVESPLKFSESPVKTLESPVKMFESPVEKFKSPVKTLESPVETLESPAKSPSRRNLRSRSRTPEVEILEEQSNRPSSPRSLRPRAKTPEKLMSPKKDPPKSAKKSLSRLVLEANAFAKAEMETGKVESGIECTPVKPLKPAPSFMDVTISPIANKSVLQSTNENSLTESVDKEKTDEITPQKSLSTFTMNETRFGKSVLNSFESTFAETSADDKDLGKGEDVARTHLKSLPAFTLSDSCFGKSVLHSYQSSVAESNVTEIDENVQETELVVATASPDVLNLTDFNKSVLRSVENSAIQTSHEGIAKKDTHTKDEERATTSQSIFRDVSSLMTSDSEMDIKEDNLNKIDSQEAAAVIQKEKEKIVEIEREIHEIEGDMSDEEHESDSDNESEDMGIESDDNSEESDSQDSSGTDIESSDEGIPRENEDIDEVISIVDTDSDASSNLSRLEIDVESDSETPTMPAGSDNVVIEVNVEEAKTTDKEDTGIETSVDPLNQAHVSIMTDDNSMKNDQSDVNLNYSDEKMNDVVVDMVSEPKEVPMETDAPPVQIQITVEVAPTVEDKLKEITPKIITQEDTAPVLKEIDIAHDMDVVDASSTFQTNVVTENIATGNLMLQAKVTQDEDNIILELKPKQLEDNLEKEKEEIVKPTSQDKTIASKVDKPKEGESKKLTQTTEGPGPLSRKRTKSTSSVKSTKEAETAVTTENVDEPKIPMTRKRSQSIASNKSTSENEQKTPDTDKTGETFTPTSRSRAKTPTSTEVRQIVTRRASKELTEKMNESQLSVVDECVLETPKRRSTRSKSSIDDNASVASATSVKSTRSKMSEESGSTNKPVRKGRKSVVATKSELSVIPELIVEESGSNMNASEDIINEYSKSGRLTRRQKAVLESWLEPQPSGSTPKPRRRASTASRASSSVVSDASLDEPPERAPFDVQSIDRISLLNKGDFEGSPDSSELQSNVSSESIASEASKQPPSRLTRALSETKTRPKVARINRRVSLDVDSLLSPGGVDNPRERRASFNRACEALTPKGRRGSTDLRKSESDSQHSSPGAAAPAAPAPAAATPRARRASARSDTSQSKVTARSKKTSPVEESKDTKKK